MPPKAAEKQIRTARGEVLKVKSPAEFFSENKNIAGFDNPGKSLYTTIRELVENSLDACEAAGVPPEIEITLHEIDKAALDKLIGITTHERLDPALYEKAQAEGKKRSGGSSSAKDAEEGDGAPKGKQETLYYKVNVKDNGCGMKHEQIPESLGRVLAGSKYGVRQTRGKFGLGAKMALIWSKQSTGLPVEVRSATAADKPLSLCVLDIDIRENKPKTTVHKQEANTSGVRGTDISFVVGGNWSKYRAYIVRYMRQMAVITPYARFKLSVHPVGESRTLVLEYARRSDEIPRVPSTIKHHPASVHVELLSSLLAESKEKLLAKFLAKEFTCVSHALAAKLLGQPAA